MNKIEIYEGKGINNVIPTREISIEDFKNILSSDKYKDQVIEIKNESDKDKQKLLKEKLDYVTFSGLFTRRKGDQLKEATGYICVDIDGIDNINETYDKLVYNPFVHLMFRSPSYKGLKVILKVNKVKDNDEHRDLYSELDKTFHLQADPSAKDITRATFVSYDPNYYYNKDSQVYYKKQDNIVDIITPHWIPNQRQDVCLHLVGYLRKEGYGIEKCANIIKEICKKTGDNDLSERLKTLKYTFEKDEKKIKGVSGLREVGLNDYVIKNLDNVAHKENEDIIPEFNSKIWDVNDLIVADIPPPEWIVENFIVRGGITIIAGEDGCGKSLVANDIALHASIGRDYLGRHKTQKSTILYLDEENNEDLMKIRFDQLKRGNQVDDLLGDIRVICGEGIVVDDNSGMGYRKLEYLLKEYNPDIVVFDSLVNFYNGDENSSNDMNIFLKMLKNFARTYDTSFLLLHHIRKNGGSQKTSMRGSGDISAQAHVVVMIEKDGDELTIHNRKVKQGEVFRSFMLRFETWCDSLRFTFAGMFTPEQKDDVNTQCANAIKKWCKDTNTFTFKTNAIHDAMEQAHKKSAIKNALNLLQDERFIEKIGWGEYRIVKEDTVL